MGKQILISQEDQINLLKGAQVVSKGGVIGKNNQVLFPGDLVYDEKNKEVGMLLGIKPLIDGDASLIKKFIDKSHQITLLNKPEKTTCILLTISYDSEFGVHKTRIRYTKSSYLKKLGDTKSKSGDSVSDLDIHCQYECFMECSEECSLWKYKRTNKNT